MAIRHTTRVPLVVRRNCSLVCAQPFVHVTTVGVLEEAYVHWIRRYVVFNSKRHPRELGAGEVTGFLTALAVEHHVAASTPNADTEWRWQFVFPAARICHDPRFGPRRGFICTNQRFHGRLPSRRGGQA